MGIKSRQWGRMGIACGALIASLILVYTSTINKRNDSLSTPLISQSVRQLQSMESSALPLIDTPASVAPAKKRSAIVALVESDPTSINQFCQVLKNLYVNKITNPSTPILLFHEDSYPVDGQGPILRKCTNSPLEFHRADFDFPPHAFNPADEPRSKVARQGTMKGPHRQPWGYAKAIRFWTHTLWIHPALNNISTVMRIDIDSCFSLPGGYTMDEDDALLPSLSGGYAFRTGGLNKGTGTWVQRLMGFTHHYIETHSITIRNPLLWHHIQSVFREGGTIPAYMASPEISRVAFFRRPEVRAWHEALTDLEPFGVFRYRWSDANTRVITMALFAEPEWVLNKAHVGYLHGEICHEKFGQFLGPKHPSIKLLPKWKEEKKTLVQNAAAAAGGGPKGKGGETNKKEEENSGSDSVYKNDLSQGAEDLEVVEVDTVDNFENDAPSFLETHLEQAPDQITSTSLNSSHTNADNIDFDFSKHAIVSLVNNDPESLSHYCSSLQSLEKHHISQPTTPILLFHEADLTSDQAASLEHCTSNKISFQKIDFYFPKGFDTQEQLASPAVAHQGTKRGDGRKPWGYAHMIGFWTHQIWNMPFIKQFDTVMRMDAESCFVANSDDPAAETEVDERFDPWAAQEREFEERFSPGIRGRYVYRANALGIGVNAWIKDLWRFTNEYIEKHDIQPRNQALWDHIKHTWETQNTLPIFHKNFEVSRVSFFTRTDVMEWHNALVEQEPFGVYRYRWSDANTRVITLALFAKPEWILLKMHPGYRHGRECVELSQFASGGGGNVAQDMEGGE